MDRYALLCWMSQGSNEVLSLDSLAALGPDCYFSSPAGTHEDLAELLHPLNEGWMVILQIGLGVL